MKKRILLFVLFINIFSYAQITQKGMRYIYETKVKQRIDNEDISESYAYLDIYKNNSFFGDKYFIEFHNIWAKNDTIKNEEKRYEIISRAKSKFSGQSLNFLIIKDGNEIIKYEKIWATAYHYKEPANNIIWEINPEITIWNNFKVQQATTNFEGREWHVLFTKELNVNNGPYKFTNLPGFVVKAWDSTNTYIFEFINSEKIVENYNYLARSHQYKEKTLAEAKKIESNHYNKTYRAFWSESQPNVDDFANVFPLDRKIGEVGNPIDLSFKK